MGSTQSWQTIRIDTRDKFSDFRFYSWPFGALSRCFVSIEDERRTRVTVVCSVCVLLSGVRSDNFSQQKTRKTVHF